MNGRLLVFNCHEAWVHQLRLLERPLDIVVGLPGRHTASWDESIRPVPPLGRLVTLSQVGAARETYDCIVGHNLTDLLDAKTLPGPRLLVIHLTLDGVQLEQKLTLDADEFRRTLRQYLELTHTHVIAVSKLKGSSWGFDENIVELSADPGDYLPWSGELARGLRVSNYLLRRPRTLLWEFHKRAFSELPVTIVGHNPELEGVQPSRNWAGLKSILSQHRYFIHTADPRLEDGYNTATLEAMAAGLPVIGNAHPTSPVTHGCDGFLSDDPAELRRYAQLLMEDRELASKMGQAARDTVRKRFSSEAFRSGFLEAIGAAQALAEQAGTVTGR